VRRLLSVLCLLSAILGVTPACSHYHLGTEAKLNFRTVYLEPVTNRTHLPQAQAILSTQLRETFARDGRIELVNSASVADATLSVVIDDYHRDVAAVREGDTGLARKFNVVLGATCTLRDNRGAKSLFEHRPVTATREIFTDGGQLQAEFQVLPLLAETLAAKIAHAALDVW
jgi:hypothetical protein